RYRRSVLGPFWIMLTNAFMLTCIGFTFSYLWQGQAADFLPYFGVSYLIWNMLSTLIGDATNSYIEAAPFIQNYATNKLMWVMRIVCRNFIILLHMVPIYAVLALLFPIFHIGYAAYFLPALLLFMVHCTWMSSIIATLSTRYRDVKQLITLLIFVTFLVTPILWKAETLRAHTWLYQLNPMFYIIELVRDPLLGKPMDATLWIVNIVLALAGSAFAFFLHRRTVLRLFYWL
ncbi:MAG TPA: ABC transporter permease, partial [Alphaproteobacteria bacterium]|nr:ABC transporter permease [Alphaproteobacteria bacterium]